MYCMYVQVPMYNDRYNKTYSALTVGPDPEQLTNPDYMPYALIYVYVFLVLFLIRVCYLYNFVYNANFSYLCFFVSLAYE